MFISQTEVKVKEEGVRLCFVVTGGSGFLGMNLLEALAESNQASGVINVDRCPPRDEVPGVETIVADASELALMTDVLHGADRLIHLAADSNVDLLSADPRSAVANNVGTTVTLLEAARRAHVGRFVLASTEWVYSNCADDEVDESSPLFPGGPVNLYAATKLAAEVICRSYGMQYALPWTILRFSTPYGPYMRPELVVRKFVEQAVRGEPLTIGGAGTARRNFIYVGDLVDAVLRAALSDRAAGRTYNVAGDRPISVSELAETVCAVVPGAAGVRGAEGHPADFGGKRVRIDLARRDLGWFPRTDLTTGLRLVLQWITHVGDGLAVEAASDRTAER